MNRSRIFKACVLCCLLGFGVAAHGAWADVIYLKNGMVMEGDIRETDQGLWINGGLFKEDEIDHIERTVVPEEKKKEEAPSWYDRVLAVFGSDENGKTKEQEAQENQAPSSQVLPMGLPFLIPQTQQTQSSPTTAPASGYSEILEHAQQLQTQAYQQQMMMRQEMQRAEQGDVPTVNYDKPLAGSSDSSEPSYHPPPQDLYPARNSDAGNYDSYDQNNQDNNFGQRRFKSIKIDDYGNMKWE